MASPAEDLRAEPVRTGRPAKTKRIPRYAWAVLDALRFNGRSTDRLEVLTELEWRQALAFCDRSQLTLLLGAYDNGATPDWVAERIARDRGNHAVRLARLDSALSEIAGRLEAHGIEYALLKGFTHSPDFTPDPLLRAQADCDLWFRGKDVFAARDVLLGLGYEPICGDGRRHLPPMARPSTWTWDGDYFSADIPIAVDLHYALWDAEAEGFPAPGERDFWERRRDIGRNGRSFPTLAKMDRLAFAALHALMHLLGGDVRLQRVWEIGNFLHSHRKDDRFWLEWERSHATELRALQVLIFRLAAEWFGCALHPIARGELAGDVELWIEHYGWSPIEGLFQPNKSELWLQLSLIAEGGKRARVFIDRLAPRRLPNSVRQTGTPLNRDQLRYLWGRLWFHMRVAGPTLVSGVRWCWLRQRLDRNYLRYVAASAFFDLGMMVFVLLYNLYLLDLGLRERFIGQVTGAMTAGTLLSAMPAAWAIRRFGIRNTMAAAFAGVAVTCALRVIAHGDAAFLLTAFAQGVFLSLWTVSFPPAIAALTDGRNRQLAFSFVFALGIGLGVPGGILGGHLPGVLQGIGAAATPLDAKRDTLLIAGAAILLGLGPMLSVRFPLTRAEACADRRIYPRSRFMMTFLLWLTVWTVATSAFNPFFNTYLSQKLRMGVQAIGNVFSWSQMFQVIAVLAMPVLVRKLGEIRSIAAMQAMTGAMFALLAVIRGNGAAAAYVAFTSFQYMAGPSVYGLLMTRVPVDQRSGASALYFLVNSIFATAAAIGAGAIIARAGYSVLLAFCAALAAIAALLFGWLMRFHKAFTPNGPNLDLETEIRG